MTSQMNPSEHDPIAQEMKRRQRLADESMERFYNQLQAKWGEIIGEDASELVRDLHTYYELIREEIHDTSERAFRENVAPWAVLGSEDKLPMEKIPIIPIEKLDITKETVIELIHLHLTGSEIMNVLESKLPKYNGGNN